MRIAYVTGRFPMLSEPFIMNQVVGALQRGCDAHVFAVQGRPEATGKVHADFARHRLAERTHYPAQPPEGTVARRASVEAALASLAEAQPRAAAALRRMAGAPGPVPWKTILRGAEIARHGPFDVIHCQFGFFADQVLALREAGVHDAAVVTTFRGGDISRYVDEQGPEVYARTFAAGDHFLANCAFFRDRAVAIGCPADRLEVHGSGIDLSRFTYKARLAPAEGPVRIATTGRLVEKKGVVYALEAVELLRHGGFDVHFDVLGDGPLRAELKGYAARLGIAEAVTFHGWRTQAEIVEILDDCHLFVASSVTADNGDQDAPVNTLKEAMAMGLPVVASDHGGIPELVRDGIAGFLVPERDGKAIAVALARLISRAPMWPDMGAAGRAAVAAQFDLAALNDR
ncbi:MAG: glycosyltransferase, partial [Pseudomonadota bacterium]